MPTEYGSGTVVSNTEVDLVTETENWTEEATIWVENATGTLIVRFYARPYKDSKVGWTQIGDDLTQEPSTTEIYSAPDMYGDFVVRGVRSGSTDTTVNCQVIWQPIEKRQKAKWDKDERPT